MKSINELLDNVRQARQQQGGTDDDEDNAGMQFHDGSPFSYRLKFLHDDVGLQLALAGTVKRSSDIAVIRQMFILDKAQAVHHFTMAHRESGTTQRPAGHILGLVRHELHPVFVV
jgi:hypothetical protein